MYCGRYLTEHCTDEKKSEMADIRAFAEDYVKECIQVYKRGFSVCPTLNDLDVNLYNVLPLDVCTFIRDRLKCIAYRRIHHAKVTPSLYSLIIGIVEMWKDYVRPTLPNSWVKVLEAMDGNPMCALGCSLVSLPNCDNWVINNSLLTFESTMEFQTGALWNRNILLDTFEKCARPHIFYNGCLLREVSGHINISKYSYNTRKIIQYGIYNLTYDVQRTLLKCCYLHEYDVAIDELERFMIERVPREMNVLGEDPSQIVRFRNIAMSAKNTYIHI